MTVKNCIHLLQQKLYSSFTERFDRNKAIDILKLLIEKVSALEATWHPLGFVHVKIASDKDSSLRLHIWPHFERRTQDPPWLIHDHVFPLRSYIVCGNVTNYSYTVNEHKHPVQRIYQVTYEKQISCLVPTDYLVLATPEKNQHYEPGQTYFIPQGTFHTSSVPVGMLTATFVQTTDHKAIPPRVLGDIERYDTITYSRSACTVTELRVLLLAVLEETLRD